MDIENDFSKLHEKLTIQVEEYIKAIIDEYDQFIPIDRKVQLNNIKNYNNIIKIYDYGSINGYASSNGISMPLCADKVLKLISKIPGFGINRNHHSYDESNLIINNNTFMSYILHIFISGGHYQRIF